MIYAPEARGHLRGLPPQIPKRPGVPIPPRSTPPVSDRRPYTRSPLQDSRLFGPRPWKILAATYETNGFLSNPDPGENLVRGNLVMETGCSLPEAPARRAASCAGRPAHGHRPCLSPDGDLCLFVLF